MNVVIHSLLHIPPLRDFLLLSRFDGKQSELVKRFAALAKKLWNPRLFKSQVSPHEFLQEVGRASAGKFRLETQGDPVEFLRWLLNDLHRDLGGSKKKNSQSSCWICHKYLVAHWWITSCCIGIIFSTFQGQVRAETQQVVVRPDASENQKPVFDIDRGRPLHLVFWLQHLTLSFGRNQGNNVTFPVPCC